MFICVIDLGVLMSSSHKPVVQRWKAKSTEMAIVGQKHSISAEEETAGKMAVGLEGNDGGGETCGEIQMDVCPKDLRFTQDSIGNKFQPPFEDFRIDDTVLQILSKLLSPSEIPPLNVVKHKGILWSLDNRRLWVYRVAGVEKIRVNLVSINFSLRSKLFFATLNEDLEKKYSNPRYSPHVRGSIDKLYVKVTGAETTLPSFPKSYQQKVISKSTASDHISIRNDAAKEDNLYLPLPGFKKEDECIKPIPMSCPDPVDYREISEAVNVSSFPKKLPETKIMPSVSVIPNPSIHNHVINIRNPNPYVPLPSSEKDGVSENGVIRFVKKIFRSFCLGTRKVCSFWYEKSFLRPCKFLNSIFKKR